MGVTIDGSQGLDTDNTELTLEVGDSEKARIDSSGNLLVGKTSSNIATVGHEINGGGGYASHTRSGNTCLFLNRTTSDGDIAVFRKDGTTVGSIGIESTGFYVDGEAGHSGLKFRGFDVIPRDNGADIDAGVNLGGTGVRFQDLYLSGGAYLGGTGSANYLDDYEEGTWTPTMYGIGTGTSSGWGRYTKIGNIVHIEGKINVNSATGTSVLYMTGFPFNGNENSDSQSRPSFTPEGDWAGLNSSYDRVMWRMNGSEATGINGTSSSSYLNANELSSTFDFNFSLTYRTS